MCQSVVVKKNVRGKVEARVTINIVPHSNPQVAIDLIANLVIKQLTEEEKLKNCEGSD